MNKRIIIAGCLSLAACVDHETRTVYVHDDAACTAHDSGAPDVPSSIAIPDTAAPDVAKPLADAAPDVPPDVGPDAAPDIAPACDDGDPCTTDWQTGDICLHKFSTAPCDDNNVCTDNDKCSAGKCAGKPAGVVCPNAAKCFSNTCDPILGCVVKPTVCDDGNLCTAEGCDPQWGVCTSKPLADGTKCAAMGWCKGGKCS